MSKPQAMSLPSSKVALPVLGPPPGRFMASQAKSVDTGVTGPVTIKQTQHYTGTKIIGIAQMAKSNAIPIYNPNHIEEVARMRR
jgi:hypothetical protein